MKRIERILAVVALATLLAAWIAGSFRFEADLTPFLKEALPGADRFNSLSNGIHAGLSDQGSGEETVGYVALGTAKGYGGPMTVAVGVDPSGRIKGAAMVEHKETAAYYQRVINNNYPDSLTDKMYSDPFALGEDVDAISGATSTLIAMTTSVRRGAGAVAGEVLKLSVPQEKEDPFRIHVRDIVLLGLFTAGFAGYFNRFRYAKWMRWVSLLSGLLVLGFLYNIPLTLVNIDSLLLGYWPDVFTHLYWYVLIAGVLMAVLVLDKSPYCEKFCPFGAAQECLGAVGGAKPRLSPKARARLRWVQRALAWGAILLALYFRNPGLSSYEVFGTLFDLTGSRFQFALLGLVLVASLFVTRPWCNYLCPMRAVTDYIRSVKAWMKEFFKLKPRLRNEEIHEP